MLPTPWAHRVMTTTTQSDRPEAYVAEDEIIDHIHPAIRDLAGRLRGANREQTASAAFAYVRD